MFDKRGGDWKLTGGRYLSRAKAISSSAGSMQVLAFSFLLSVMVSVMVERCIAIERVMRALGDVGVGVGAVVAKGCGSG